MVDGRLRIGLLQCGHIHPDLIPTLGDYPELFGQLFAAHDIDLQTYLAVDGTLPASPDECDGWLVSGSADSTYDDLPWIAPLEDLLRRFIAESTPLVAICFGHQLLAQAMGGRVAKADVGWGVGVRRYDLVERAGDPSPWMAPPADGALRLLASHQDQVVELPPGANLLATSDYCPVGAYTLGPAALAIQPHPEFTPAVSAGLLGLRRDAIGPERCDEALDSLAGPIDRDLTASWMIGFLRAALAARG